MILRSASAAAARAPPRMRIAPAILAASGTLKAVCRRLHARLGGGFSSGTDRVILAVHAIGEAVPMRRGSVPWLFVVVAVSAMAVFVALTIAVTAGPSLGLDSRAFQIADDLRAP